MAASVDIRKNLGGDGEIRITPVTVATLPATLTAADAGAIRVVSDAGAGNVYTIVVFDGTNWIDVSTGSTVAA